jgi:hypothetical protein
MKETSEFRSFFGAAVNGAVDVAEDGKVNGDDLGTILNVALKATPAFRGIGEIDDELAKASISERDQSDELFGEQLSSINEENRRDIVKIENGVFAAVALISRRAYQKGKEEGQKELVAKLKAGEITVDQL